MAIIGRRITNPAEREKMGNLVKYLSSIFIFFVFYSPIISQLVAYQDVFKGGIVGSGVSVGGGTFGNYNFDIFIEPNSTVRKAFLICQRYQSPSSTLISLNGISYTLDMTSEITDYMIFNSSHASKSGVHIVDITQDIDPNQLNYNMTINIPNPLNSETFYGVVYLLILYENPLLDEVCLNVVLNNQDLENNNNKFYTINNINPINIGYPVGFAINTDRVGVSSNDGSNVYFNSNHIGLVGGQDMPLNVIWGGVKGHFYYQNNLLYGLDDDVPNTTMNGTDGLADVSSYILNNSTSYNFNLQWQDLTAFSRYNIYISFFLSYTTSCDTFSTTLTDNVNICKGDTAFLAASGGIAYEWLPQVGLSCYNCATPYYKDTVGKVYTCRIWNTDSCSKVLPVKINVLPLPIMPSITVNPTLCSGNTGHIHITNQPAAYTYRLDNGTPQTTLHFNNLSAGNHLLTIQAANGCSIDTLLIVAEINNVVAQFTASPTSGDVPLTVNFTNQSANATNYSWYIENDTLNTTQANHTFDTSGFLTVTLVAYNNFPQCSDTAQVTIVAEYPFTIIAPSLYVSDENYAPYQIYTSGVKELHYELFTDQGKLVYNKVLLPTAGYSSLWNSNQLAKGMYLYRIWAVDDDGVEKVITGKVVVM